MADGSIRISSLINVEGIKKGFQQIINASSRLTGATKKIANANAEAFGPKTQRQLDRLNQKFARQQEAVTKAANASQKAQERQQVSASRFEESISKQSNLVDQLQEKWSKVVESREAEQNLKRVEEALGNAKKQFEESAKAEDQFFHKLNKSPTQEGLAKFRELQAETKRTQSDIKALEQEASRLREVMMQAPKLELTQKLQDDLELATSKLERLRSESQISGDELQRNADLAAQHYERLTYELGDTSEEIRRVAEEAEKLPDAPNKASRTMDKFARSTRKANKELQRSNKSAGGLLGTVDKLGKRLLKLGAAVFVFNILRKGLRSLQDYLWAVMRTNDQFIASLASAKGNLLTAFQPIYESALPAINALGEALARVTGFLAAFVSLLFGKSLKASQNNAKALYDQAKALDEVGASAKSASKQLAAFDDLDVRNQGSGTNGVGVIAPEFDYDFSWFDALEDRVQGFLDVFRKAWSNVGDYVIDGWNHALGNVLDLARKIGATFYDVWTDGHGQALLEAWLKLLGTILFIIGDIAGAFSAAWDSYGYDLVSSIFDLLTEVGLLLDDIGVAFRAAWDEYGITIVEKLLKIITNISKTIFEITKRQREAWAVNENGEQIWKTILGTVDDVLAVISRMSEATLEWAKDLNLAPIVTGFRELLEAIGPVVDIITSGIGWAYENVLLPFGRWLIELTAPAALGLIEKAFIALKAIFEAIQPGATWIWENFLVPLGQWTGQTILDALQFLGEKFQQVTDWIHENGDEINAVIEGIGYVFTEVWKNLLSPILDTAWVAIKGVIDSIIQICQGLITFLSGTFAGEWAKAWEGIKDIFKGIFNGIVSIIEGAINLIIDAINFLITRVNGLSSSVSGSKRLSIPQIPKLSIPKLATGAVIPPNSEFLAVLDDQKHGTNIEAPLDTIVEAVLTALENAEIGGGDVNVNINFNGDLAGLARLLNPVIEVVKNQSGPNFVIGGAY